MLHLNGMILELVTFDRTFLDLSWDWLHDEEIGRLTMTPPFTREDQFRFFGNLPSRTDYRAWGVRLSGVGPIGAAGLKGIEGDRAEYWGYIGEKRWWGMGLGQAMVSAVEKEAQDVGIRHLTLSVSDRNRRAVRLYEKMGYRAFGLPAEPLVMEKDIGR